MKNIDQALVFNNWDLNNLSVDFLSVSIFRERIGFINISALVMVATTSENQICAPLFCIVNFITFT